MQKEMSAHDVNYGEITGVEVAGFVWWITSAVVYGESCVLGIGVGMNT